MGDPWDFTYLLIYVKYPGDVEYLLTKNGRCPQEEDSLHSVCPEVKLEMREGWRLSEQHGAIGTIFDNGEDVVIARFWGCYGYD